MHPSLERLHGNYAQVLRGLSLRAVEDYPGNDPTRWNARQIVEHLTLTYQSSSAVFHERLAKGRPTQAKPSAYQRVQQFFVCQFGFIPAGRPAPPEVIPSAIASAPLDGNDLSARLQAELQAMDALLAACQGQFMEKKFATHQILGPISADQWRRFHLAHGRHHLKQLRRLHSEIANLPK
jgi:DinB superfamily